MSRLYPLLNRTGSKVTKRQYGGKAPRQPRLEVTISLNETKTENIKSVTSNFLKITLIMTL